MAAEHLGGIIHARIAACDATTQHDPDEVTRIIAGSFSSLNQQFRTDNKALALTVSTTAACALILHEHVYVAHAGDSRITVVFKKGADGKSLVVTTKDHALSSPEELMRGFRTGAEGTPACPIITAFKYNEIQLIAAATKSIFEPRKSPTLNLTPRSIASEFLEALDYEGSWEATTNSLGLKAYENSKSFAGAVDNLCLLTVECGD